MGIKIGTKHGSTLWLNSEPCGFICGIMTWFLLFFGMYSTSIGVIIPWLGFSIHGIIHLILFNGISLVALYSHIKVMTTDPGAVPPKAKPLADDDAETEYAMHRESATDPAIPFKKYCRRCKGYKPQRAHHCSICGRCIVKMDHHCPWVNNCVGVGNHKLFLLFVFWVFVSCMYSMLLVLSKYIVCLSGGHKCHASARMQFLVIFLVVESILFGLFTLCMLGDQLSAISSNQTQIDRLKGTKHNYQMEVNEVCGSVRTVRFHYSWLLPVPVNFPEGVVRDKVLGYRLSQRSGGHGSGGSAAAGVDGADSDEEFNPLLEGEGGAGGAGNAGEGEGDVEMGNLSSHPPPGGVVSSPGGGYVLRKKLGSASPRGGESREDEDNSMNTSNESLYGAEESITEWLDSAHAPMVTTNTSSGGGGAAGGAGGVGGAFGSPSTSSVLGNGAFSAGASPAQSASAGGGNHGTALMLNSSRLADLALGSADAGDGDDGAENLLHHLDSSGGSSGSPHVRVSGAVNGGGNHNTTRRKRSGIPGAM